MNKVRPLEWSRLRCRWPRPAIAPLLTHVALLQVPAGCVTPETIWSVSAQVVRGSPRESARQLCMKYGTTIPLADAVRQELPGFMQRAVASAPNPTES